MFLKGFGIAAASPENNVRQAGSEVGSGTLRFGARDLNTLYWNTH